MQVQSLQVLILTKHKAVLLTLDPHTTSLSPRLWKAQEMFALHTDNSCVCVFEDLLKDHKHPKWLMQFFTSAHTTKLTNFVGKLFNHAQQ